MLAQWESPHAKRSHDEAGVLRALIAGHALRPHFQPIVQLADGEVWAHEALIRTPPGCPWRNPDELFAAAARTGLGVELELECVRRALAGWSQHGGRGRLFLNLSARALVAVLAQRDLESLMTVTEAARVAPEGLVVELTEHEHVRDVDTLMAAVTRLRRHKVGIALDDFGDGRSSLRLWSELKPEFVKVDKYFTREIATHPEKVQTLRALLQISQTFGSALVAEGIESGNDLLVLRDLGVRFGQGWALGRPAPEPVAAPPVEALAVIRSRDVAIIPERRRPPQQRASTHTLMREIEPLPPSVTCEAVFALFNAHPEFHAVALVEHERPVGLIGRVGFIARYAQPFFRDLYGRKPSLQFANPTPKTVDLHAQVDELTAVLTSQDQRYLSEGIVITEHGRYRGLASGEDLVRAVTEARIEAARHANPLTLLPGNIPITQHIERLLAAGRDFVACYADLNHFKPFNDLYGYWRGDEMILMAARCLSAQADPQRDFLGHVGGDDFVILFQSEDWQARCRRAVADFNAAARELYDDQARAAGGVMAEDRHGVERFHPLTTLSIGAARMCGCAHKAADAANLAARAKRAAKARNVDLLVLDEAPDC